MSGIQEGGGVYLSTMWETFQRPETLQRTYTGSWQEIIRRLERILPINPNDYTLHIADTITVPALSITKITFTLNQRYIHYIRKLYIDATPDTMYEWQIDNYYRFIGNEHELSLPIRIQRTYKIVLLITNNSTEEQSMDYVIDGWSRWKG